MYTTDEDGDKGAGKEGEGGFNAEAMSCPTTETVAEVMDFVRRGLEVVVVVSGGRSGRCGGRGWQGEVGGPEWHIGEGVKWGGWGRGRLWWRRGGGGGGDGGGEAEVAVGREKWRWGLEEVRERGGVVAVVVVVVGRHKRGEWW